jgi:hypothetical protein
LKFLTFSWNIVSVFKKRGTVCPKTKTQTLSIVQGQPKLATLRCRLILLGFHLVDTDVSKDCTAFKT